MKKFRLCRGSAEVKQDRLWGRKPCDLNDFLDDCMEDGYDTLYVCNSMGECRDFWDKLKVQKFNDLWKFRGHSGGWFVNVQMTWIESFETNEDGEETQFDEIWWIAPWSQSAIDMVDGNGNNDDEAED